MRYDFASPHSSVLWFPLILYLALTVRIRPMDSFGYHALCCSGSSMNRRLEFVADALSAHNARL